MSMFDAHEEYRPENVIEIFLSDFTSIRPHETYGSLRNAKSELSLT
jgi:hypothetical protein